MKKRKWFSVTGKDCKWTYFNPPGGGGQNKNKNMNGARCKHEASGAVGKAGDLKSRKENKRLAFERMANTSEFQSWLKLKTEAGFGNVEIQQGDEPSRLLNMEEV